MGCVSQIKMRYFVCIFANKISNNYLRLHKQLHKPTVDCSREQQVSLTVGLCNLLLVLQHAKQAEFHGTSIFEIFSKS